LENGIGIERNAGLAQSYYSYSADQGHSVAQVHFGLYLETDKYYAQSYRVRTGYSGQQGAVQYYKRSADQGNSTGQFHYGRCLEQGIGIGRDHLEAMKWFYFSADQGYADAIRAYSQGCHSPTPT
jgi:TPR repeat protein